MRNNDKGEDFSEILPFVEVIRFRTLATTTAVSVPSVPE